MRCSLSIFECGLRLFLPPDIEEYCSQRRPSLCTPFAKPRSLGTSNQRQATVSGIDRNPKWDSGHREGCNRADQAASRIRRDLPGKGVPYIESRSTESFRSISSARARRSLSVTTITTVQQGSSRWRSARTCFLRYGEKRQITRLYVQPERFDEVRPKSLAQLPLSYEEEDGSLASVN